MKEKMITFIFCFIFFGFLMMNVIKKDETISIVERRKLAQLPDLNIHDVMKGKYMTDFEQYALDQIVWREQLQSLKTKIELQLFQKRDVHGLFVNDNAIFERNEVLDKDSLHNLTSKMKGLVAQVPHDNVYFSIIPDKGFYLDNGYNPLSYEDMVLTIQKECSEYSYIDLFSVLNLDSYYRTDSHWKQEKIGMVAETLVYQMHGNYTPLEGAWKSYEPFYGVYYGRLGVSLPADEIRYLSSDTFDDILIYDIEKDTYIDVYDESKLRGYDPYDIYLSGSKPILEITNPQVHDDSSIVIFRDSYASSLIPLMIPSYHSITVIDTRYVNSDMLLNYIDYANQDILFLYSSTLVNHSRALK